MSDQPLPVEYVYEASVSRGRVIHAVILDHLPPPSGRAELVYRTVCGRYLGGSDLYPTPFDDPNAGVPRCRACTVLVATRRHHPARNVNLEAPHAPTP